MIRERALWFELFGKSLKLLGPVLIDNCHTLETPRFNPQPRAEGKEMQCVTTSGALATGKVYINNMSALIRGVDTW